MSRGWRDRPELVAHDVVTRALHRVGGLEPGPWSEALEALTRSIDGEARLHRAGRRRARAELVDLAVSRSRSHPDTAVRHDAVWVIGLPGTGADELASAVAGRLGTTPVDPLRREFCSISFEVQWHAPSYGEWLATADLTAAYHDAATAGRDERVLTGWGHLERLAEVAATATPGTRIAVVDPGVGDDPAGAVAAASARARRRDSADVDDAKVDRYWRWRIGELAERLERALGELPADRVRRWSAGALRRDLADDPDRVVATLLDGG